LNGTRVRRIALWVPSALTGGRVGRIAVAVRRPASLPFAARERGPPAGRTLPGGTAGLVERRRTAT